MATDYYNGAELSDIPTGFGGCTGISITNKGNTTVRYTASISKTSFDNLEDGVDGNLTDTLFLTNDSNSLNTYIDYDFSLDKSEEGFLYVFHKPFVDFFDDATPQAGEETARITIKSVSKNQEAKDEDIIIDITGNRAITFPTLETVSSLRGIQDYDSNSEDGYDNGYNVNLKWSYISGLSYATGFKIEAFSDDSLTNYIDGFPEYKAVNKNDQAILPQYGHFSGLLGTNYEHLVTNLPVDSNIYFRVSPVDGLGSVGDPVYATGLWQKDIDPLDKKTYYGLHPSPGMNFKFLAKKLTINYNDHIAGNPIYINNIILRENNLSYDLTPYSGIDINFSNITAEGFFDSEKDKMVAAINMSAPETDNVGIQRDWTYSTDLENVFKLTLNFRDCIVKGYAGDGLTILGFNEDGTPIYDGKFQNRYNGGPIFDFDFLNYLDQNGNEKKFEFYINKDKDTIFFGGEAGGNPIVITDNYRGILDSIDGLRPDQVDLIKKTENKIPDLPENVKLQKGNQFSEGLMPVDYRTIPNIYLDFIKEREDTSNTNILFHFGSDFISSSESVGDSTQYIRSSKSEYKLQNADTNNCFIREAYGRKMYEIIGKNNKPLGTKDNVTFAKPSYDTEMAMTFGSRLKTDPSFTILVFALAREELVNDSMYETYFEMFRQANTIHRFVSDVDVPEGNSFRPGYNTLNYGTLNFFCRNEGENENYDKYKAFSAFTGSTFNNLDLTLATYDAASRGPGELSNSSNSIYNKKHWFFSNPDYWPNKGEVRNGDNRYLRRQEYGVWAEEFTDLDGVIRNKKNQFYPHNLAYLGSVDNFDSDPSNAAKENFEINPYSPPTNFVVTNSSGSNTEFKMFNLFFVKMHSTLSNNQDSFNRKITTIEGTRAGEVNVAANYLRNETFINGMKVMDTNLYLDGIKIAQYNQNNSDYYVGLNNNAKNDSNPLASSNTRMFLLDYIHGTVMDDVGVDKVGATRDRVSDRVMDDLVYKNKNLILKSTNTLQLAKKANREVGDPFPFEDALGFPTPIVHPFLQFYTDTFR